MHGLICKSLESFVRDRHGDRIWQDIVRRSVSPVDRFESLRRYDDEMMERVFSTTFQALNRSNAAVLEDVGHWICTHPPLEPVRRLIRFSGTSFVDLIYSLDEIHDRARIALPGLGLPKFFPSEMAPNDFLIRSSWHFEGGGAVLTGMLRAMADDYGALAIIESQDRLKEGQIWEESLSVQIFDQSHQAPREFTLGATT